MLHIGIFGGTFDPPHNGHLLIANEVLIELRLDEIWFMPNNIPPHKEQGSNTTNEQRIDMLKLAIKDQPAFRLQTIELEREGPSYTYETMKILTEKYGDIRFYFIIGGDMVEYLPKWHHIEELLEIVSFVGVKRPGFSIHTPYPIISVDVPQIDVSSSMLRKRIAKEIDTRYLLPESVRQYIKENKLYGSK